ncbi:MAG: cyclodeaminase/cyclohydrolase family protein [Planctomycetes bacterium]|nr:cyclodeaminase/cyclohydrolase family protein [Planctomycetota bacterium]
MAESPLANVSIEEFLDRLASDAPTPGGGAVAALTGALAASLGRMVCGLTAGKKKFADVEPQVRQIASRLTRAGLMLKRLIDEDAAAYAELSGAFKMEKSDPRRKGWVAETAGLAAAVPLQTVAVSRQVLGDLRRLEPIGNPNLRPDVEAGIHLVRAAMHAAAANVRVNLPLLPEAQARKVAKELDQLLGA